MSTPAEDEFTRAMPDEIVVASQHADRVVRTIGPDLTGVKETSDLLGLSRVVLTDVAAAQARFEDVVAAAVKARRIGRPTGPLEAVMAGVRLTSADRWDGWMPRMGKNRVMLGGESQAITVPRADGDPVGGITEADLPAARPGGAGVLVGMLDTPVRRDLALDGRLLPESSRMDRTDTAMPLQGHGTFTAGLVHQQAADADIVVRGVLAGREGNATAWEVAVALLDLVRDYRERGLAVVNMSLGCFTEDNRPPLVLETAVGMVRDDVVLVAAGGNHGRRSPGTVPSPVAPMWPAALDGVVAVGGRIPAGDDVEPAPFTPRAPWLNLLADGTDVASTYVSGKVSVAETVEQFDGAARWSGGSMAAANAAGRLAALSHGLGGVRGALGRILAGDQVDPALSVFQPPL